MGGVGGDTESGGRRGILGCPPPTPLLTSTPAQASRQVVAGAQGQNGHGWSSGKVGFVCREKCSEGGGGGFGHQILGCGGTGGCRPTNGIQDPSHGAVTAANQDAEIWHVPKEIEPGGEGKGRKEGREGGQGWLPPSQHLHTPCPIPSLPWVGSSLLQVVDLPGVQQVLELPEHSAGDGKVGWGGPTLTSP